jgi:hypothetical protein
MYCPGSSAYEIEVKCWPILPGISPARPLASAALSSPSLSRDLPDRLDQNAAKGATRFAPNRVGDLCAIAKKHKRKGGAPF